MDIANLSFRTFAHATEDPERVERALKFVSGVEDVTRSSSTGYHGNPILVLEAKVTDSKHIKALLRSLGPEALRSLLDSLDRRLDDESFFYFRLDKQEAFLEKFVLTDGDDVIAVRGKVKSYPQNRDNAMASMRHVLEVELARAARVDAGNT
ncbi:MAG: RNA-binding domain-containing protein [Methanomassiliicoccus sp.]|nr:RNA-binding domain-containing protein [Methanomassiliicoccus sp.]